MPVRGPLTRLLRWIGALGAGGLAVVGGLGLQGVGLVAVASAGVLAACTAVGVARDVPRPDRRPAAETAVQAGAWTIGLLLVLTGLSVLAGGLVAALAAVAGAVGWLCVRLARATPGRDRPGTAPAGPAPGGEVLLLPVPPPEGGRSTPGDRTSPVTGLSTPALGREWLRTTAALGAPLSAGERQALVRRRAAALDELERRDPAGFARWLADGPAPGSDPAGYVRGRQEQGDPATGTDAA